MKIFKISSLLLGVSLFCLKTLAMQEGLFGQNDFLTSIGGNNPNQPINSNDLIVSTELDPAETEEQPESAASFTQDTDLLSSDEQNKNNFPQTNTGSSFVSGFIYWLTSKKKNTKDKVLHNRAEDSPDEDENDSWDKKEQDNLMINDNCNSQNSDQNVSDQITNPIDANGSSSDPIRDNSSNVSKQKDSSMTGSSEPLTSSYVIVGDFNSSDPQILTRTCTIIENLNGNASAPSTTSTNDNGSNISSTNEKSETLSSSSFTLIGNTNNSGVQDNNNVDTSYGNNANLNDSIPDDDFVMVQKPKNNLEDDFYIVDANGLIEVPNGKCDDNGSSNSKEKQETWGDWFKRPFKNAGDHVAKTTVKEGLDQAEKRYKKYICGVAGFLLISYIIYKLGNLEGKTQANNHAKSN